MSLESYSHESSELDVPTQTEQHSETFPIESATESRVLPSSELFGAIPTDDFEKAGMISALKQMREQEVQEDVPDEIRLTEITARLKELEK